ncbi:MAG: antibiotic biosynthesis monooxygenase [Kiritimatiellae bacterium]|nr:antibiotic biosynthesis monooxygenase [Kiritimatiellia bacterium]
MITELATLDIIPGEETAFEQTWVEVECHIASAKGYLSHELLRGVESPSRYVLIIRWETVADHMQGFRESEAFQKFRPRVAPFYAASHMEHFGER